MKKIDVQNGITKYLNNNQITIEDALSKSYNISSYEEYIEFFMLIKNTYKNNIKEFYNEGKKYLDKLEEFITEATKSEDSKSLEAYIQNNLKNKLGCNYCVEIESLHPKSFSMQRESSKEAFVNVYTELGYDKLKQYIKLVKSPSNFISYLNNDNNQIVAMKYLLFKTDHHSMKRFKRDCSSKTIYQETENSINECIEYIAKEKENFASYLTKQEKEYNDWFENTSKELNDYFDNHNKTLFKLEQTYEEELKVEKPAEFILDQSNKYKKSFRWWCVAVLIVSIILIGFMSIIVSPEVSFNDKLINISILNKDMPVYSSVILLALISLIVYILRVFIKMAISSKHLMEEYKQKYALTYFYLSLVHNGNIDDIQSRNIILTSLFTKADTGLIKNDNSTELDKTILSLLTNLNK